MRAALARGTCSEEGALTGPNPDWGLAAKLAKAFKPPEQVLLRRFQIQGIWTQSRMRHIDLQICSVA